MSKGKEKIKIKDVLKKDRFYSIANDYYVFIIDSHNQDFINISELGNTEDINISDLFVKNWYDINDCHYTGENAKTIIELITEYNNKHEIEKGNFNWNQHEKEVNKAIESKEGLEDKEYTKGLQKQLDNTNNYYGGENNTYEAIKVIHAHNLGFD
jgi:hypothetical protein